MEVRFVYRSFYGSNTCIVNEPNSSLIQCSSFRLVLKDELEHFKARLGSFAGLQPLIGIVFVFFFWMNGFVGE